MGATTIASPAVDGRFVFKKIYTVRGQVAGSTTHRGPVTANAPLWNASFDRQARSLRLTYSINASDPDFRAASGFLSRIGIVNTGFNHRYTIFGKKDGLVQSMQFSVNLS